MENKEIKNVAKEAGSIYGSQLKKTAPFLFMFFLITVVVWLILLLLNYSGYGSIFMTILVIGAIEMPCFLGVQICSYMSMMGQEITFSGFFRTCTLYFKREFNGVYRVINSFLFSFLIALAGGFLFSLTYYIAAPSFDAAFSADVEALMNALEAGENGTVETLLAESQSINAFNNYFALTVDALFVITVVVKLARNSAMVYVRDFLMASDPRLPVAVYKDTVKNNKDYNKDFFKATWFVFLLIILFYFGGIVFASFVFKDHAYKGMLMNMMGIGFGAIPGIIMLPYFLNVIYFLTAKYKKAFLESSLGMAKKAFDQLMMYDNRMSDEDKQRFKEALDEYEKQIKERLQENPSEEIIEEEPAEDEDDHHDNNLDDYGSSDHH